VRKGNIRDWNWKDTLSLLGVEKAVLGISLYIFEVRDIYQGGSQPTPSSCLLLSHHETRKQNTPSVLKQTIWYVQPCCPSFGWDKVNFFPTNWYSAVFWI